MIIVNGETANITVNQSNQFTVTGNRVNIEVTGAKGETGATGATGATGQQGVPGTPALERKFAIYRVRKNNNTPEVEVEELINKTSFEINITANLNSNIDIVSTLFEDRPFNVVWNGGILGNNEQGYIFQRGYYLLPLPSYVFSDFGSGVSDWSYVIIEDLSIYLT